MTFSAAGKGVVKAFEQARLDSPAFNERLFKVMPLRRIMHLILTALTSIIVLVTSLVEPTLSGRFFLGC